MSRAAPRIDHDSTLDSIEQGVARGEDDETIARLVGVTVGRVKAVRSDMNRAVARSR